MPRYGKVFLVQAWQLHGIHARFVIKKLLVRKKSTVNNKVCTYYVLNHKTPSLEKCSFQFTLIFSTFNLNKIPICLSCFSGFEYES